MDQSLLRKHIKDYYIKSNKNKEKFEDDLKDRIERTAYYKSFDKDKIVNMDEDSFYEYISKLWAMLIWGNKKYMIDKIIKDNGFQGIKNSLATFLYGEDNIENRWNKFRKSAKNFGSAMASEILNHVYPDKYMLWNRRAFVGLRYLGVEDLPKYDYQLTGKKYVELCEEAKKISDMMEEEGFPEADMLFVDYFIWDELQFEENLSAINKKSEEDAQNSQVDIQIKKDENQFIHNEIRDKLYKIGTWLGFTCQTEVKVAPGAVVDVVWEATIGNMGRVIYIFEVQTKGSIDSLILNLIKSMSNTAVQGIVAVSDEKQLRKITAQCESIKMLGDTKLKTWNYKEVLQNYEALEAVNESINNLNLVPDGFYTKKV